MHSRMVDAFPETVIPVVPDYRSKCALWEGIFILDKHPAQAASHTSDCRESLGLTPHINQTGPRKSGHPAPAPSGNVAAGSHRQVVMSNSLCAGLSNSFRGLIKRHHPALRFRTICTIAAFATIDITIITDYGYIDYTDISMRTARISGMGCASCMGCAVGRTHRDDKSRLP